MKILYVHGFLGKANGESSKILKKIFNDSEIDAPDIPFMNPEESVKLIRDLAPNYDLIIASSLGAFYSMQQSGTYKILINPAMPKDLVEINGQLDSEYIKKLEDQFSKFYSLVDFEQKNETYLLFGINDTIAKNNKLFEWIYYPENINYVTMGHRLEYSDEIKETLLDMVNSIKEEMDNDKIKY